MERAREPLPAFRQLYDLTDPLIGAGQDDVASFHLYGQAARLNRALPALHARDCEAEGFEWLVVNDNEASVFAWLRKAPGAPPVAVISNMTPMRHGHYRLPLPHDGVWREVLNSDAAVYGGSGQGNLGQITVTNGAAHVILPPLSTLMFAYDG
mgnify:CR=1 FL=1